MKSKEINHFRLEHNVYREGLYFEEFVYASLRKENANIKEENHRSTDIVSKNYDAFLPNGLNEITNRPSFLEIKYSNNPFYIDQYIKRFKESDLRKPLIVICLINDEDISRFKALHDVFVLGSEYVSRLLMKHPSEWWVFVASCSLDNRIEYDEGKKELVVQNPPLAAKALGKTISLSENSPDGLSYISESDFKTRLKSFNNPAIIIGNGASIHFGSDLWGELSDSLFDYLSPGYVDNLELVKKAIGDSTYSTTSMSRFTINLKKFDDALHHSVYRKYEAKMHIDNTLIRSVVRIKQHYLDMPLLTYNYDDFLETDYELFTHSLIEPVISSRKDAKTPEPKIRHVHGFIPYKSPSKKTRIVLTQEEYFKAYKGNNWVSNIQRTILTNHTCLFVGSSMSDLYQMSLINDVRNKYYSSKKARYTWKCFALLCFKGMTTKDIVAVFNYFLNKGVYIIFVKEFAELPGKLLSLFNL